MSANLNKTGLILMASPLHVARFCSRKIIVLLIDKCVEKEVIQGIVGSFFFFVIFCVVLVPTNSPFNSQVIFISELLCFTHHLWSLCEVRCTGKAGAIAISPCFNILRYYSHLRM